MSILDLFAFGRPWIWGVPAILFLGLLVAVARRGLTGYSRKKLLERLKPERRERFTEYLDDHDSYDAALRFVDQMLRMALAASAVLVVDAEAFSQASIAARMLVVVIVASLTLLSVFCVLELAPAVIARLSPERLLIFLLPMMRRLLGLLRLPMRLFEGIVSVVLRAFGKHASRKPAEVLEAEILSAAEEGQREGLLQREEISMIEAIIEFRDREVSEVLTPRTEMVAIKASNSFRDCVRLAVECGHSRIPVYGESKDDIVGVLYAKDLLQILDDPAREPESIEVILREPHFVPETKKVSELFQEFKTQRFHIAIVLDEFGGTSGLITIEDIIEEILGEIEEEDQPQGGDPREERVVRVDDGTLDVDGRLAVHELNRMLSRAFDGEMEIEIPEGDGFETVGGFVSSSLGRIPAAGEKLQNGSLQFEVTEADERSIQRLTIRLNPSGAEASKPA